MPGDASEIQGYLEIGTYLSLLTHSRESLGDSHFRCLYLYMHRCSHFRQLKRGQMNYTLAVTLWPQLGFTVLTFCGMPAPHHVCLYFTLGLNIFWMLPADNIRLQEGALRGSRILLNALKPCANSRDFPEPPSLLSFSRSAHLAAPLTIHPEVPKARESSQVY